MYTHIHAYTHTYIYRKIYVCTYTNTYIHTNIYIYIYLFVLTKMDDILIVQVGETRHCVRKPTAAVAVCQGGAGQLVRIHNGAALAVGHHHVELVDGLIVDYIFQLKKRTRHCRCMSH